MPPFTLNSLSPILLVSDLERSIRFYTEDLGFNLTFRFEEFYAGIDKDGFSIHLKLDPNYRPQKREPDSVDLVLAVNNVEDIYQGLTAGSIVIVQPLRKMPYGKECYIADPDGHILSFLQTG